MANTTLSEFNYQRVLDFWFADCASNPEALQSQAKMWFTGGEALDRQISEKFNQDFDLLTAIAPEDYGSAQQILGAVIVLDQFSRNCFRGQARAFAYDALALSLLDYALDKGWDETLSTIERGFLYMPLQHAESLVRQRQSLAMFGQLVEDAQGVYKASAVAGADHAQMHLELIERFGRFPHRNRVLERTPTAAETAYLDSGGKTFGQ